MTVYPIARGTLVNFAAFTARYDRENTALDGPAVVDVPRDAFLQDFAGWEPEVQALLDVRLLRSVGISRANRPANADSGAEHSALARCH